MDTIKELFEGPKFDDLIVDIYSPNQLLYNVPMRSTRCKNQTRNYISIDHAASELVISLATRYDNQELYEILCSLVGKIGKSKHQNRPLPKREKLEVKKEYQDLYENVEKHNDEIQEEFYSLVSRLKLLNVECAALLSPLPQYIPDYCYNWREYECYQNCGILITCTKSSELFEYITDKFKTSDNITQDYMISPYVSEYTY